MSCPQLGKLAALSLRPSLLPAVGWRSDIARWNPHFCLNFSGFSRTTEPIDCLSIFFLKTCICRNCLLRLGWLVLSRAVWQVGISRKSWCYHLEVKIYQTDHQGGILKVLLFFFLFIESPVAQIDLEPRLSIWVIGYYLCVHVCMYSQRQFCWSSCLHLRSTGMTGRPHLIWFTKC